MADHTSLRISFINTLMSYPVLGWGLGISAIGIVIQWVLVGLFIWRLPPEIPFWYSLPTGKLQLADRQWFILLPGLALGLFVFNLILIRLGLSLVRVFTPLMMWLLTLAIFLLTVAMAHIIIITI